MEFSTVIQSVQTKTKKVKNQDGDKLDIVYIQVKSKSVSSEFVQKYFTLLYNMINCNSVMLFDSIKYTPMTGIKLAFEGEKEYEGILDGIVVKNKDGVLSYDYSFKFPAKYDNEYLLTTIKQDGMNIDIEFK